MAAMTRREAREAVFELLFETEFTAERTPEQTLALACEQREMAMDDYVKTAYLGAMEHRAVLDVLLGRFSNGWKTDRMSRVSRAVLRLCTYEMLYCDDIPTSVSLNEAVELAKKFDDPKARAFVNGVLNSIKNEIEDKGAAAVIAACEAGIAAANEPISDDE
jgi:N utilization substance protein B